MRHTRRVFSPACVLLLTCAVLAAGCGGGGGSGGGSPVPQPPVTPPPVTPARPNPVGLTFRPTVLPAPAPSDGRDYRTAEYLEHWGLDGISAEAAYQRGYFGQGVTIAVADDGMDLTHPDLAGRITAPRRLVEGDANVRERNPENTHGTYVAMIAAGARGNTGGPFEVKVDQGFSIPTKNVHGVAPRASIMPVQIRGTGPLRAVEYVAANRAHVLNFSIGTGISYYGRYAGRDGVWLTLELPHFRPLFTRDLGSLTSDLPRRFADTAAALRNRDIVVVWAAGNERWNSRTGGLRMCGKSFIGEEGCPLGEGSVDPQEFMRNFEWLYNPDDLSRTVRFRDMWGTDCGSDDCAEYNSPGGWKEAPRFEPGLLGKWLVVGALTQSGEISVFSNGCGAARNWCLMAPGENLALLPGRSGLAGTSFAAPMVSGALAVLKSRLPAMPMEVVQAVLLASADPLGTRVNNPDEPDPVYGWGRLNLANAVTMQGTVRLPYSIAGTTQAAPLQGARITLSPALTHVGERLQAVDVAVGGIGDAYYNMSLGDVVRVEAAGAPVLGYAAGDMLTPAGGSRHESRLDDHGLFLETGREAGEIRTVGMDLSAGTLGRWRLRHDVCDGCEEPERRHWSVFAPASASAPFFAHGRGTLALQMQGKGLRPFAAMSGQDSARAPWRQYGLQWRHGNAGYDVAAEVSRIDERRSVWGASFGTLGATRTETRQLRLSLSGPLAADWRGFAGYEHGAARVSAGRGMLSRISGLRAQGWSAGTEARNLLRDEDTLRFSVRRRTAIRNGNARIDHTVATGGSFVDAFYRGRSQSLESRHTVVDLRAPATTHYALGYALPVRRKAQLAFGIEYEGETRNRGVSLQWRQDF